MAQLVRDPRIYVTPLKRPPWQLRYVPAAVEADQNYRHCRISIKTRKDGNKHHVSTNNGIAGYHRNAEIYTIFTRYLVFYILQAGLRHGGLTPACGSAHARNGHRNGHERCILYLIRKTEAAHKRLCCQGVY